MEMDINPDIEDTVFEMLEICRRPIAGKLGKEARGVEKFLKGIFRGHAKAIMKAEKTRVRKEMQLKRIVRRRLHSALDAAVCL